MLGGGAEPIDSDEDFAEDNEELLQILEQDDNESIQNNCNGIVIITNATYCAGSQ